jgi:ribonuclease-3
VPDLAEFQKIIGVDFQNLSLLEKALVHRSYINENPSGILGHNEKLEFLGDAVLGFVVAEELYQGCPDSSEGDLTRRRAALVNGNALARAAKGIGLGDFLYLGRGEESGGGRENKANLAGALEAVIAAVCLDQGLAAARDFILRLLDEDLKKVFEQGTVIDYKSRLQEMVQTRSQPAPGYRLVAEAGPDHDKTFTVEVKVGDAILGRGTGKSKKEAETRAARFALEKLENGLYDLNSLC